VQFLNIAERVRFHHTGTAPQSIEWLLNLELPYDGRFRRFAQSLSASNRNQRGAPVASSTFAVFCAKSEKAVSVLFWLFLVFHRMSETCNLPRRF